MQDALATVRALLLEAQPAPPARLLAVAGQSASGPLRESGVLQALRREKELEVRLLSDREEARLKALAVCSSLQVHRFLLVDLDEGSLRLAKLRGQEVGPVVRMPLSAEPMTQGFRRHVPPTPADLGALRRSVRREVRQVLPAQRQDATIVGVGGHLQALARLHLHTIQNRRTCLHALRMNLVDVTALRERLQDQPCRRGRPPDPEGDGATGMLAGAMVIEDIMTLGGYPTLTICTRGVVHGLLVRETFGEARFS